MVLELLRAKKPIVIAIGERLAITAVLDEESREDMHLSILKMVAKFMEGDETSIPKGILEKMIFYSLIYGGMQLVYIKGPVIPISRYLPQTAIGTKNCNDEKSLLTNDEEILDLWAILASGYEDRFFERVSSYCLVYPEGLSIDPRGKLRFSPVGFIQEEQK